MTIYSQRDQRWANILLGYNQSQPYTIGNYGCLITCLSSYLDKSPDQTNQLLKDNGGFTSGSGDFIWGKSPVLGLDQTYVSPRYVGPVTSQGLQKAKDILDQGYPLLCEVDFNPNTSGEEMHFVLILRYDGDSFYAMDPWVGEIINLSVYGGPQRAIIQFRSYDKKLDITPQTTLTPTTITDQTKIDLGGDLGLVEVQAIRSMISDLKRDNASITSQRDSLASQLSLCQNDHTHIFSLADASTQELVREALSRPFSELLKALIGR